MRRARLRTGGGNLRGFPPPFVSEAVAGSRESVARLRCGWCSSRGVHHLLNQMMMLAVLS